MIDWSGVIIGLSLILFGVILYILNYKVIKSSSNKGYSEMMAGTGIWGSILIGLYWIITAIFF